MTVIRHHQQALTWRVTLRMEPCIVWRHISISISSSHLLPVKSGQGLAGSGVQRRQICFGARLAEVSTLQGVRSRPSGPPMKPNPLVELEESHAHFKEFGTRTRPSFQGAFVCLFILLLFFPGSSKKKMIMPSEGFPRSQFSKRSSIPELRREEDNREKWKGLEWGASCCARLGLPWDGSWPNI